MLCYSGFNAFGVFWFWCGLILIYNSIRLIRPHTIQNTFNPLQENKLNGVNLRNDTYFFKYNVG